MPIRRRSLGTWRRLTRARFCPSSWTSPPVASSSRMSSLMSVDLPAPEGPTRKTKSPFGDGQVHVVECHLAVGVAHRHVPELHERSIDDGARAEGAKQARPDRGLRGRGRSPARGARTAGRLPCVPGRSPGGSAAPGRVPCVPGRVGGRCGATVTASLRWSPALDGIADDGVDSVPRALQWEPRRVLRLPRRVTRPAVIDQREAATRILAGGRMAQAQPRVRRSARSNLREVPNS